MSTLKAANIQSTTTGAPTFKSSTGTEIGQLAKAWINFDGQFTVSIRDSFNVSSLVDNATGDYTINFTNALGNANFVVAATCAYEFNHEPRIIAAIAYTTSSVRVETGYSAFNNQDEQINNVIIFGA